MGNYTSNQDLADKKLITENGLDNKLLKFGQLQQHQQPATTSALDQQQQQQQQKQSNNEIEMKNLKKKIVMDENDIKVILHTFDIFINQVLQEKLSKMDGSVDNKAKTKQPQPSASASASAMIHQYKEPSTQTIFDNLAQMLSTHLDDYLDQCKRSGIVMAPAYKSCTEYSNNFNNANCNHHHHNPQQQLVEQQSDQQRRMSNLMSLQSTSDGGNNNNNNHNNTMDNMKNKNNLNNVVNMDNIRINLPEILDQQDEVTIMRLLIKLLSNKVRKLSDENRFLLQQISALNDINTELASILQHKFGK